MWIREVALRGIDNSSKFRNASTPYGLRTLGNLHRF